MRGYYSISEIVETLRELHPDARYELNYTTALDLLVATILAAQCTDERVNRVTEPLFRKYRTARDYAEADTAELEEAIRPTGTFRQKARWIQDACSVLVERFGGEVPAAMDELLELPGVGRKTANVVLNTYFRQASGIIVDTHVARTAARLGLTKKSEPDDIEQDLMRLVPPEDWIFFGAALVLHGRYVCTAQAPKCEQCPVEAWCKKTGVESSGAGEEAAAPVRPASRAARGGEPAPPRRGRTASSSRRSSGSAPAASAADEPSDEAQQRLLQAIFGRAPAAAPPGPGAMRDGGLPPLPASWRGVLGDEVEQPYFRELEQFVSAERREHTVFPPRDEVFNALELTPFDQVRVFLLGQDPYHDHDQAHGLAFSVRPGIKPPPSLVNMYKELRDDLGCAIPPHGHLEHWARQGVLLLNAVLTVRAHTPNSHKNRGWETFTDAVLRAVAAKPERVVFLLWGAYAQKKAKLIDTSRHVVLKSAHPSPLSARNGFFGSRPFSAVNAALREAGRHEIDWCLPPA